MKFPSDRVELSDTEKARQLLSQVPHLANEYADWVKVGMACKNVDESLRGDWVAWSRQGTSYKSDEDCFRKWDHDIASEGTSSSITIASMVKWAKEADPTWRPNWSNGSEKSSGAEAGKQEQKSKDNKAPDVFMSGDSVLAESMVSIENDEAEIRFDCGDDLSGFELCPGKITIVGAPPGTGKTTLASQACFHALSKYPDLSLWIANAEMEPHVLVKRELSRRSGVNYRKVRFATYSPSEKEAVQTVGKELIPLMRRSHLMAPPYEIERLIESLPDTPGLLIVDYLQKFRTGDKATEGIEAVMGWLRYAAMAGWAVFALSSTARQEGSGNKHDTKKLDMGSFRGSGEIEFQADFAYVLRDQSNGSLGDRDMLLDCVKNRHDSRESLELVFRSETMHFESQGPKSHSEFDSYATEEF